MRKGYVPQSTKEASELRRIPSTRSSQNTSSTKSEDNCLFPRRYAPVLSPRGVELEATGIKASERLDRMKYEREREANRERITRLRLRIPDGYTEDLEPVEASVAAESPGPTPKPVLEQSLDAVITDTSDIAPPRWSSGKLLYTSPPLP